MKKILVMAVAVSVCVGATIAMAQNCDPALTGLEFYYCKLAEKEFQIGLKKDSWEVCVEHKKMEPTDGCVISLDPGADGLIYIVGKLTQKDKWWELDWQCAGGTGGEASFDGNWHPNYWIDKFPGEDNAQRRDRFNDDLKKQGKQVLGAVRPFSNVCQFYNAKTDTVGVKFIRSGNAKSSGGDDAKKGLKKLFGR